MLSIFTIPKPFSGHTAVIQRNAIESWQRLDQSIELIPLRKVLQTLPLLKNSDDFISTIIASTNSSPGKDASSDSPSLTRLARTLRVRRPEVRSEREWAEAVDAQAHLLRIAEINAAPVVYRWKHFDLLRV